VARARGAGAVLEGAIASHPWGRIALMADPFGNGFCLVQFVGRGYDEVLEKA
jgi:predicted enzyme related to lactoylglutathione lyase